MDSEYIINLLRDCDDSFVVNGHRKVDYLYSFLSSCDISSLVSDFGYDGYSSRLKAYKAMVSYYRSKLPVMDDLDMSFICECILKSDFRKVLVHDIGFRSICKCNYESFKEAIKVLSFYSFFKSAIISYDNGYYDIEQNKYSLKLLLRSLFYPDYRSNFLVTFFNCFQDLDLNNVYCSYSQALTSYYLKVFERLGKIKIVSFTESERMNLNGYKSVFLNSSFNDSQMYEVYFEKLSSFSDDVFGDFLGKNFVSYYSDGKVYYRLNSLYLLKSFDFNKFKVNFGLASNEFLNILTDAYNDFLEEFSYSRSKKYVTKSLQLQHEYLRQSAK